MVDFLLISVLIVQTAVLFESVELRTAIEKVEKALKSRGTAIKTVREYAHG
jgi:hypothetical protein